MRPAKWSHAADDSTLPPAIVIGGSANAMSVSRSLGDGGVAVYLLCPPGVETTYSRFTKRLDVAPHVEAWIEFLLSHRSDWLRGAVLLACSDDAVQMLLEHREALIGKYVLDLASPEAQWCFLNKLSTYEAAREAGVPTPLFWRADGLDEVRAHEKEYVYPLIVKPLFSHRFKKVFTGKYLVARDFAELVDAFEKVHGQGVEALLLEEIPGDDDRLCSCFTYLDENGEPSFAFTKRVIRRYPEHQGFGCYHITDWEPDVWEAGLRLVQHVGLRGLANVEFKRDRRDGKLKVIECNIRFTAANQNVVASGYDLPLFVYGRLVGMPLIDLRDKRYGRNVRLWFPVDDFSAFLDLRRQGRLTASAWLTSVLHRQSLPYFRWDDPLPSLAILRQVLGHVVRGGARRALKRPRASEGRDAGRGR
jgi:D-aspartate ligase